MSKMNTGNRGIVKQFKPNNMRETNIMTSASALQRCKVRFGITVNSGNATSSYISVCKMKKALRGRIQRRRDYDSTEKLIQRLEKLPHTTIKSLRRTLDEHGVETFVDELNRPMAKLMRPRYQPILPLKDASL